MTAAERVAWALASRLPGLNAAAMSEHVAFVRALHAALAIADEQSIVAQVVALGGLQAARNPGAVVVARLRQLPALAAKGKRIADEATEVARWRRVDAAARRGETLRELVAAGTIYPDEATRMLREELPDHGLRAIAEAALVGGSR
ncbi:MAG: hypothetical protein M0010_06125 [Actinomycetota bacterium]|nr:hypothetical protein [Actinomycetota bacterium]